jgi:pilus assembly protein Flp/PilA
MDEYFRAAGLSQFVRQRSGRRISAMNKLIARFVRCESGATSIEYSLIAVMIGVVIITVLGEVGSSLKVPFVSVKTGFDSIK